MTKFFQRYDNELHRFHFRNLISPRTYYDTDKEKSNVIQQQYQAAGDIY